MTTMLFHWEAFKMGLEIKFDGLKHWEGGCHLIKQGSKKHNRIFWSYLKLFTEMQMVVLTAATFSVNICHM
jgi:hypothetical protein